MDSKNIQKLAEIKKAAEAQNEVNMLVAMFSNPEMLRQAKMESQENISRLRGNTPLRTEKMDPSGIRSLQGWSRWKNVNPTAPSRKRPKPMRGTIKENLGKNMVSQKI